MKKLCTIFLLILAMSLCLASCDLLSTAGGETTAAGEATDAPATNGDTDSVVTENVVVTDDAGNAVTDDEGNVVTEVVVVPNTDAATNGADDPEPEAPEVDGDVTDAPSADNTTTGNAPSTDDDTPTESIPVVTPAEKTPAAWYAAAYQTMESLTNGTIRYGMIAESEHASKEMYATVKIANGNYSVQEDDWTPVLYVDGIAYTPEYKEYVKMSAEDFCNECFPYYPLTNGMLPLTAEHFEGVTFEEEDGVIYFVLTLTGAEYGEMVGEDASIMDAMICTVSFTPDGIMKQAVFSASFSFTDEKTGETSTSTSSISVELSDLGTTAAITAPEDADEYTSVDLDQEVVVTTPVQNNPQVPNEEVDVGGRPSTDKDDMNGGKDDVSDKDDSNEKYDEEENGKLPSDKNPEYNGNVNVSPEEIYKQEIHENADLNGDGVIGVPEAKDPEAPSPEKQEPADNKDEEIYEKELQLGVDLNKDGYIGYPESVDVESAINGMKPVITQPAN